MICPKCRRRFDDNDPSRAGGVGGPAHMICPDDQTPLVGMAEFAEAGGDPLVGRTLDGRFTLLARLGAGSMGTVYRARQHAMGRDVAVKILRSDRAIDANAKGRFLREARANSLLASPHTVTVFDFGQSPTGELFLAMELLDGESLGQRITRLGRLPGDVALDTMRQALRSLSEAHAKGIIHRDLKPDNLFYAKVVTGGQTEEIVKVLDFGVAKMVGEVNERLNAVETQAGTVFGTPRYMSPEQAQGKPLDARTDLYSLGVILYHMLTGRPPFTDDDAVVVMARHIKTSPQPASVACPEARIAPELDSLLMRLLAKEPAQRPASAEAFLQEIARLTEAGLAVTSGVRTSVATGPAISVREAVAAAGAALKRVSTPAPPLVASAQPGSTLDSLDVVLIKPHRGRRAVFGALALTGALGVFFGARWVLVRSGVVGPSAPMATVVVPASAPPAATNPPGLGAPPTPQAPTAAAPKSTIPSVSATDLPRATAPTASAAMAPPAPRRWRPRPSGRGTTAVPATSASSSYGLLE